MTRRRHLPLTTALLALTCLSVASASSPEVLAEYDALCASHPKYPTKVIVPDDVTIQATWQPSFPGSGADMTLTLVFGLTGLGQEPASSGPAELSARLHQPGDDAVTVKTHYPRLGAFPPPAVFDPYEFMDRSILVLRHPMNALPSYHNQRYEITSGIPSHTVRAPVPEWIVWRDANFDYEMARWVDHTVFWLDHYRQPGPDGNIFLSIYEGVTDDVEGPAHAQALANFLDAGANVHAFTDEVDVKCAWYKILKDKSAGTHRGGPKYRPYTPNQLDTMSQSLLWLRERYENEPIGPELVPVLNMYLDMVEEKRYEERPEPTWKLGRKKR